MKTGAQPFVESVRGNVNILGVFLLLIEGKWDTPVFMKWSS